MKNDPAIDIHAHFYPQAYLDLVAEAGAPFGATCGHEHPRGPTIDVGDVHVGPLARKFTDLELRIEAMDAQGVDVHALSLTLPMVYWAGPELGRRLAECVNDSFIAAHQAYPERFVGLATLPAHEPKLALAELDRVAGAPGIRGAYLATRVLERDLSDEALLPIFERLEAEGLPLFLHPVSVIGAERLRTYYLANLLGNPFETAIAAAHLIFGGVLDRFPRLEVCLPHAGGAFPFLVGRLHQGWKVRPECKHLERGPLEYLSRFHYDTVAHSADSLAHLISIAGAGRIMLGSDYCFPMGYERPVEVIADDPNLEPETKTAILGGNARKLLGL